MRHLSLSVAVTNTFGTVAIAAAVVSRIIIINILTYSRHFRQAQVWDSKSKGS